MSGAEAFVSSRRSLRLAMFEVKEASWRRIIFVLVGGVALAGIVTYVSPSRRRKTEAFGRPQSLVAGAVEAYFVESLTTKLVTLSSPQ
jgi:hypothetical protein